MSYANCAAALDTYFAAFPGGDAVIVYEGITYDPVEGTPFLSSRLSAYTRSALGVGADCWKEETGSYQISVYRPAAEGRSIAAAVADSLVAYFPRGLTLTTGQNTALTIEIASAMPAQPSGAWMQVPVVVSWISAEA